MRGRHFVGIRKDTVPAGSLKLAANATRSTLRGKETILAKAKIFESTQTQAVGCRVL